MLFQPKHRNLILLDAPADGGEGGSSSTSGGGTGNAPGDPNNIDPNSGKPKPIVFESEAAYQADLEAKLKDRLEREQKKAQAAAEKARQDAEAEAAKKNGEWQKLAEQREKELADLTAKLTEMEPIRTQAEKYQKALEAQLAEAKKAVPAHVLPLLEKLPVDEQLAYIAANADKFKAAGAPPASPNPADNSEQNKAQKDAARPSFERTVRGMFG